MLCRRRSSQQRETSSGSGRSVTQSWKTTSRAYAERGLGRGGQPNKPGEDADEEDGVVPAEVYAKVYRAKKETNQLKQMR